MIFVGAAFGGPSDILCHFKDCQCQNLQINIYDQQNGLAVTKHGNSIYFLW